MSTKTGIILEMCRCAPDCYPEKWLLKSGLIKLINDTDYQDHLKHGFTTDFATIPAKLIVDITHLSQAIEIAKNRFQMLWDKTNFFDNTAKQKTIDSITYRDKINQEIETATDPTRGKPREAVEECLRFWIALYSLSRARIKNINIIELK